MTNRSPPWPGSNGEVYGTETYGTTFYVDPADRLITTMMIQAPMSTGRQYSRAIHYLACQALVSTG